MLEVKDLCFGYNNHPVLNKVSLHVNKGEVICLLGENGAGKTTLFKCIMGFFNNYKGNVQLNGDNLKDLAIKEIAKKVAYIPQAHEPTYNYSVTDIVLMGTTILVDDFKNPGKSEMEIVSKTLTFLDIAHLANRGYAHLSGGERQLVLIARALAQKSEILIMDEPTANLDYGNQIKVMRQAKTLANQGYTILISTHNPEHALHFADKVLILNEGCSLLFGTPENALTSEIISKIYGVDVELPRVCTSWGQMPLIAPKLM